MKNLIFLCASVAVVIFTVIVLNNAPIINRYVGNDWYEKSCQYYVDLHKYNKDEAAAYLSGFGVSTTDNDRSKKKLLDLFKEGKNNCYRKKAMVGLEYSAFNFKIYFGFACALLGLFNYLKIGNLGKIIGIIGLGSGVIGFVLTLVYIIYRGIIFTQDVVDQKYDSLSNAFSSAKKNIRSDGAFAEWDESKKGYVCIFYKKDKPDSLYLKFSDYGNKHLNYRTKDIYAEEEKNYEYMSFYGCRDTSSTSYFSPFSYTNCKRRDESNNLGETKKKYYDKKTTPNNEKGECDYLYYSSGSVSDYKNKILYDRWVITIVFGCFIFVLDLCLAIFGFLIFKDGGSSGTPL